MTSALLTNIGELLVDPDLPPLLDAAVVVESGRVAWVGPRSDAPPAEIGRPVL